MAYKWVVVAHRGGARFFKAPKPGAKLELVEQLHNPEGKLRNHELGSDKPGRTYGSAGKQRHALSTQHDERDHQMELFATTIARKIEAGRVDGSFSELTLVAEPRFLGKLRAALSKATAALVREVIEKDFAKVGSSELTDRLSEMS